MQAIQIDKMGKRIEKLECELSSVNNICYNIYTLSKERIVDHEPEVDEPRSREEIVPDFLSLKVSLDTDNF